MSVPTTKERLPSADNQPHIPSRELAEETLQALLEFTLHLEQFSRQAALNQELREPAAAQESFTRLIDGIQTFTDALLSIKQTLRIGRLDPINLLEADLASILQDLLQAQQTQQKEYSIDLMRNHLPVNIEEWRVRGLPILIRSRDS